MNTLITVLVIVVVLALVVFALAVRVVRQYERSVLFHLGRVVDAVKSVVAIENEP